MGVVIDLVTKVAISLSPSPLEYHQVLILYLCSPSYHLQTWYTAVPQFIQFIENFTRLEAL